MPLRSPFTTSAIRISCKKQHIKTRDPSISTEGSLSLLCPGSLKGLDEGGVPDVHHLGVSAVVGVHAVAVVGGAAEAGVLVDDPDGGLGLVLLGGPRGNGGVELLDLCVEVSEAEGDDLGDLFFSILSDIFSFCIQPQNPEGKWKGRGREKENIPQS